MRRVLALASDYAQTDTPVLVKGETGTGKELIARAIHAASGRAGQPFVVVDCGALIATLLANELIGHEKGAYPDAAGKRSGLFAAAHKGSLFIDEIAELPRAAQSALLRVLSDGTYRPLGSVREVSTDVRVIATTSRDLQEAVARGAFSVDLFLRIRAVVDIPAAVSGGLILTCQTLPITKHIRVVSESPKGQRPRIGTN